MLKKLWGILVVFLILFCGGIASADTITADLSQAQLSQETVYQNGAIKLKSIAEVFENSKYIYLVNYSGRSYYFTHGGQLYYKGYSPSYSSQSFTWQSYSYSSPIKQADADMIVTQDGNATLWFYHPNSGSVYYNLTGVKKIVKAYPTTSNAYIAYFVLKNDGSVKLVTNYYASSDFQPYEISVIGLESNVVDIAATAYDLRGIWAVKSNGEVWGAIFSTSSVTYYFGSGYSNCSIQLPTSVTACKKQDISNVVKVVGGPLHTLALLSDGTVMCWGVKTYCGVNKPDVSDPTPERVKINSSTYLTDVIDISNSSYAASAITNSNTIYVWGIINASSGTTLHYATQRTPSGTPLRFLLENDRSSIVQPDINSNNSVIPVLLSNGTLYNVVANSNFPSDYVPPPLQQQVTGSAVISVPVGASKAVTSLSANIQGNIRFLFSVDNGSSWYKYSSGAFILATSFNYSGGNTYSEVTSIPEAVFKNFTKNKNSLKIAMFLQNGTPEPQINGVSVQVVDLITVSDITCDSLSAYPGQTINCNSQIQKDSSITDPLNVTWQILKSNGSNGGEIVNTSNNGDIYTATIRPIGADTPKTVKVNACVGSTCVSKTQELIVQSLQAPQISLNCPTSLYVGQSGDCVATIQLPEGLPSYITPVINWDATTGTQLTPSENTASVLPVTETDKTVTVKVSYNYAPDVFSQRSANIQVLKTEITGSLNCPTEAYKGQVITCTLQYQSTREGLDVQWLTPVENLSEDKRTAQIKVLSNTVTVKVFVTEYPSLYKMFTANLTMKTPPKPIVNVSVINSSGNTTYVNIPVTLKGTVVCPEGLTCSHEWYINDELQQIAELEFSKTFSQSGRQKISLVAWVNEVEQRDLVTSRFDYQLFVYDYPKLYMYAMVDKKYATVGDTVTFTAVDASKTDYSSIFPVKVSWILPDGSTVEGKTATYTVKESDVDPANVVKKVVIFNYQYEGIPESLKSGSITLVMLPPYKLPDFDIKLYTPQEGPVPHLVFAAPKALEKFLPGYQYNLSYEWSIPELGITGNKKYFAAEITEVGNFTLNLKVSDTLGNSVEKEVPITVIEPLPWTVDFKTYLSNKYKVAPLNVIVKPILFGGHPRDKVVSYSWYVDGQEVSNRSLLGVTFNEPGTYTISFNATTRFGNIVTGEYTIEVNPNQPPVCSLSSKVYSGTKTLYVTASCTDPDGRIVEYLWRVNNGEEFKGGSKISVKYDTEPITVTLKVTDTGGNVVEVTETFPVSY